MTKRGSVENLEWNGLSAVVHGEQTICLKGRGELKYRNGNTIMVHGYELNKDNVAVVVPFESPGWASWVTVELQDGEVEISSTRLPPTADPQPSFTIHSAYDPSAKPTVFPKSWIDAADSIIKDYQKYQARCNLTVLNDNIESSDNTRFITAIAGAKGVGKSTCLRYLIHRLLAHHERVAILDADTGQPEFTPPGMLSLCTVTAPLLSPPHMHMVESNGPQLIKSIYFGESTAQVDPSRYLDSLGQLVKSYRDMKDAKIPLIVNMDGWVKGFGMQIVEAILQQSIRPHHVIQIQGETKSQIFDLKDIVSQTQMLHEVHTYLSEEAMNVQTHSIPSHALRSLRLCTYFLKDRHIWDRIDFDNQGIRDPAFEIANSLAEQVPYVVPLDAIKLKLCSSECLFDKYDERTLLKIFNASVVGLCQEKETSAGTTIECFGMGIVRSIDPSKRLLYVLTPLALDKLQHVNILLHGSVQLPAICFYRGPISESFPYISFEKYDDLLGSQVMKSRNNIYRKQTSM